MGKRKVGRPTGTNNKNLRLELGSLTEYENNLLIRFVKEREELGIDKNINKCKSGFINYWLTRYEDTKQLNFFNDFINNEFDKLYKKDKKCKRFGMRLNNSDLQRLNNVLKNTNSKNYTDLIRKIIYYQLKLENKLEGN